MGQARARAPPLRGGWPLVTAGRERRRVRVAHPQGARARYGGPDDLAPALDGPVGCAGFSHRGSDAAPPTSHRGQRRRSQQPVVPAPARLSERARRALAEGKRLKLVASAVRDPDGHVVVTVAPVELPASDLLAGLDGKANGLVLRTDLLGEIGICQLEGNLTHTAYALLSDLLTIRKRQGQPAMPARQIP